MDNSQNKGLVAELENNMFEEQRTCDQKAQYIREQNRAKFLRDMPIDLTPEKGAACASKGGITLVRKTPKVYPNDKCTCGSGLKAKKCCYEPYKRAL